VSTDGVVPTVRRRRWPLWLFRVVVTLSAVLLFNQAVFAGEFLSGTYPALAFHREFASLAGISVMVTLIAAILLRFIGRDSWWPILSQAALVGCIVAQIVVGYAGVLFVHVPLGVATIMAMTLMAVWSWRSRR
jgi:hypothetical protein